MKLTQKARHLRKLFSKPSKMEGFAFSISAYICKTGSKLREDPHSVCANCYARKGRYSFPSVQQALDRRWSYVQELIDAQKGKGFEPLSYHLDAWQEALAGQTLFRWHDSGDLQSLGHLRVIVAIALVCPWVSFWLPTKEQGLVSKYLKNETIPPNLCVRISAHIKDAMPAQLEGCTGSMVDTGQGAEAGFLCPATYGKDKTCKGNGCQACYDPSIPLVSYKLH